jgi:hypothetical protein
MKDCFEHELAPEVAALVRSARLDTAGAEAADSAQGRLMAKLLPRASRRPGAVRSWRWIAATASLATVLLLAGPMLVGSGDAFASVQKRFRDFQWLSMTVTQRFRGQALQTSRTLVNRDGLLRTDVGSQLSVVVDPKRGRVLTLLHDERKAMLFALPKTEGPASNRLQWLDDLRAFKGKATPLPTARTIDGRRARGWQLDLRGQRMQIWADSEGLPLQMLQLPGNGLEIDYRFDFNPAVAARHISSEPPPGYTVAEPDED